jgi:CTP-dependent riboflavin kinase
MQIKVDWDNFLSVDLQEFRNILKWMSEKADYIEQNFTKKGQIKTVRVKGETVI